MSDKKLVLLLILISLVLRGMILLPVVTTDTAMVNDEFSYFSRACGWSGLMLGKDTFSQAYFHGFQPPLWPITGGLSMLLTGNNIAVMRLLNVILTAITTGLIFLFGRHVVSRKAAIAAAAIHILYPSFTFFSHTLWSEPLFNLLLVIVMLLLVRPGRKNPLLIGFVLGLLVLTRPVGLSLLVLVPIWFWKTNKLKPAVLMLVTGLLVLLPWQLTLYSQEGRVYPASAFGGLNLLLGNSGLEPDGLGSTWRIHAIDEVLFEIPDDVQRRDYAISVIAKDLPGACVRVVDRLRMFLSTDFFLLRHVLNTGYRPGIPPTPISWLLLISYTTLVMLIARGIAIGRFKHARLFMLIVVGLTLPVLMTIGISRFHQPLLVLALPIAGSGAVEMWRWFGKRALASSILLLTVLWAVITGSPLSTKYWLESSSFYLEQGGADRVSLRTAQSVEFEINGQLLVLTDKEAISVSCPEGIVEIVFDGKKYEIELAKPENWMSWHQLPIPGVEFMWAGGDIYR
ncbi:hypothetical protein HN388_02435 [bacterium]|nr:hypothetical protein [bacterium]